MTTAMPTVTALESRSDITSLEQLHHERRQLLITLAPLKALHGSFGLFDNRRKQMVEAMKVRVRARLIAEGTKLTEAMIDAEAHNEPQYLAFLDQAERDKIDYINQENLLSEIEEKIRSREVELLAYQAEIRLQR